MSTNPWSNPNYRQQLRLETASRLLATSFPNLTSHPADLQFAVSDAVRAADALMAYIEDHPVE